MLAKPFTRDGMIRILKKHLTRMLKDPQSAGVLDSNEVAGQQTAGTPGPGPPGYGPAMAMAGNVQVKLEQTPIQSPSTTASWHSPSRMQNPSPNFDQGGYMNATGGGGGGGVVLTPGGTQRPPPQYSSYLQAQAGQGPPLTRVSEGLPMAGDDRPEKRQRLYAPGQGGSYVQ